MLASGSADRTVRLWEAATGKFLRALEGHKDSVRTVAFAPLGRLLASGGDDKKIKLWEVSSGRLLYTLAEHHHYVLSVAFNPLGDILASGSADGTVRLWDLERGQLLRTFGTYTGWVFSIAFDPSGGILASGGDDKTVKLWEANSCRLLRTIEGHTSRVDYVAFSPDGRLLASKSNDGTVRLWNCETWETVAVIKESAYTGWWSGCAFHPSSSVLAAVDAKEPPRRDEKEPPRNVEQLRLEREAYQLRLIHLWELSREASSAAASETKPAVAAVHHTTAKIVLVGDHSVGKSALGWRLTRGAFKAQESTHGQQFWVFPQLGKMRDDGTECEAILWDLAGQPDYRLIHALFLDDVDLALVLFDSSDISDPLHGVEFWLKQLRVGHACRASDPDGKRMGCQTILVGSQADRGTPTLTVEEVNEFCRQRGIGGYVSTSALTGLGLDHLTRLMKELIPWEDKPATVTTVTFKRIKDYVLKLKESRSAQSVVVSPEELRRQLERTDSDWQFTDPEMLTAVSHLENYGYVKRLRASKGEERVLLGPELLNNLASSFVLQARSNPEGLGSLEEKPLLAGEYPFPELKGLSPAERNILLDSAALLFLEHNICFRETNPLHGQSYLVFPELINLKKPPLDNEQPTEEGVAYTVTGAIENVYASLVVLLGYTQTFTRRNQWRDHAQYEVGDRLICGFRQDAERDGELDFVLYFGTNVGRPVRTLFQGLFESFLARRNLSVFRFEPVICSKGHPLNRAVVREQLRQDHTIAFCSQCSEKLTLPKADEPIQLTQTEQRKVDEQQWFATHRSRFEQAIFQVMSYMEDKELSLPECFISYAWGDGEHERWVERNLATDLRKAGIKVVLDRWENVSGGKSVSRFLSRIAKCDIVIPVGTPLYLQKFENRLSGEGNIVASEVDLISQRLMGTEKEKETVIPVLLEGDKKSSLPPLMWDRVSRVFSNERAYFITAFDLILDVYRIAHSNPAVADLRESLRESRLP